MRTFQLPPNHHVVITRVGPAELEDLSAALRRQGLTQETLEIVLDGHCRALAVPCEGGETPLVLATYHLPDEAEARRSLRAAAKTRAIPEWPYGPRDD